MNEIEIQRLVSELSDKELRKWCLETAIDQANKVGIKSFISGNAFESVRELEKSHMSLANAYYSFLTGQNGISTVRPEKDSNASGLQSASKLLKERNMKAYPAYFNKKMEEAGLMVTRKADSGYNYKELTEAGLAYGENKKSPFPNSPTQPLYYGDKFDDLLNLLDIYK